MMHKLILLFMFNFIFSVVYGIVYAEKNINTTKGFLETYEKYLLAWKHTGNKICFECHMLTLSKDEYERKFSGCNCHEIKAIRGERRYKIDMSALSKLHGTKPCIRCHSGGYSKINLTIFHFNIHRMVNCTTCHGYGMAIKVEDINNCYNCHEKNIHYIHTRVLRDLCSFCHSKTFALEYTERELKKIGFNLSLEKKPKEKKKEVKEFEGPTILKILYTIINFIVSIFK